MLVQKKLQMRTKAQAKYFQTILLKAREIITFDINSTKNLTTIRTQLTNFSLTFLGLMENVSQVYDSKAAKLGKKTSLDSIERSYNSAFQLCQDSAIKKAHDTELVANRTSLVPDMNVKES